MSIAIDNPTPDSLESWIALNHGAPYGDERDAMLAPYPPAELMQVVSGLTDRAHFAQHGATIFKALADAATGSPWNFNDILDFGCGCGRLARLFKGYPGTLAGCDVDTRLVNWINEALPYMHAIATQPNQALPFDSGRFDCVISISVFTHLDEDSQDLYLRELQRCTRSGARLFLTIHGMRAMERAQKEQPIFDMLSVPVTAFDAAQQRMREGRHAFILQEGGHLTTDEYRYGITFIPDSYVYTRWGEYFEIERIVDGAIHDFQAIVVCRRR